MQSQDFRPHRVRYIKLGRGGAWADRALADRTIPFGYHAAPHAICVAENWPEVHERLMAAGRTSAGASQGVREVRDFYTLPNDTLWTTITNGHLWWAFASGPVVAVADDDDAAPSRYRPTCEGWSCLSLTGEPLSVLSLSSALTRTANYRMTICEIERSDYLLRRIRGEAEPLHTEGIALQAQVRALTGGMIAQLHWQDLETLTDLIFARDGWRRTSVLGQDQPDVDMILEHATTKQRAWVQVKARAGQAELDRNREDFERQGTCDRFYFVCGQPAGPLRLPTAANLQLWVGDSLAAAAIDAGLFQWLIDRTR